MAELRPFPSWESVLSAVECNIACMKSDEAKMRLVWVHLKAAFTTLTAMEEGCDKENCCYWLVHRCVSQRPCTRHPDVKDRFSPTIQYPLPTGPKEK